VNRTAEGMLKVKRTSLLVIAPNHYSHLLILMLDNKLKTKPELIKYVQLRLKLFFGKNSLVINNNLFRHST